MSCFEGDLVFFILCFGQCGDALYIIPLGVVVVCL